MSETNVIEPLDRASIDLIAPRAHKSGTIQQKDQDMDTDDANSSSEFEMPTEIIVPTHWAETMMAKGKLQLTSDQIDRLEGNSTISLPSELVVAANPPRTRITPVEWLEPIDAVHWLSQKVGGDAAAKSAIAERLRDGAIECLHVWMSEGPDIGPISKQRPKFPVMGTGVNQATWVTSIHRGNGQVRLGGAFWAYSDDWDADLKRWDWRAGLFVASRQSTAVMTVEGIPTNQMKSSERARLVVSGIRFSQDDVRQIIGNEGVRSANSFGHSELKRPKSKAGRKPSESWDEWVAQAVLFYHEEGIDLTMTPEKLLTIIENRLAERGIEAPSRSRTYKSAKAVVEAIQDRWSEPRG